MVQRSVFMNLLMLTANVLLGPENYFNYCMNKYGTLITVLPSNVTSIAEMVVSCVIKFVCLSDSVVKLLKQDYIITVIVIIMRQVTIAEILTIYISASSLHALQIGFGNFSVCTALVTSSGQSEKIVRHVMSKIIIRQHVVYKVLSGVCLEKRAQTQMTYIIIMNSTIITMLVLTFSVHNDFLVISFGLTKEQQTAVPKN